MPTKDALNQWLQLLENQKADPAKREKIRGLALDLILLVCDYIPPEDPLRAECITRIGEVVAASSNAMAGKAQS
jgi:hypothetical protein